MSQNDLQSVFPEVVLVLNIVGVRSGVDFEF